MKAMNQADEMRFQRILREIKKSEKTQEMKKYIQHGSISTYDHCERVARMCYRWNKAWGEPADMVKLVRCAFLHDFYLYDWHEKKLANKIHGFTHPKKAASNAKEFFGFDQVEQDIIASHMWPLTIHRLPFSKEAWMLCLSDKYVATMETLTMRQAIREEIKEEIKEELKEAMKRDLA